MDRKKGREGTRALFAPAFLTETVTLAMAGAPGLGSPVVIIVEEIGKGDVADVVPVVVFPTPAELHGAAELLPVGVADLGGDFPFTLADLFVIDDHVSDVVEVVGKELPAAEFDGNGKLGIDDVFKANPEGQVELG